MARALNRLTALRAARLKQPGKHADGAGLYLQIAPGGSCAWVFRFMLDGREREMGLGPFPAVSLARAREKAQEARALKADGNDPIDRKRAVRAAARRASAQAVTFESAATRFVAAHRAGWGNAEHAEQWESTLRRFVLPVVGALPVASVDTAAVLKILEPIWTTKTETAGRVRGRIESVLDWAAAQGYRAGDNPARFKGHLDHLLADRAKVRRVEHHAALPYVKLPAFMSRLRAQDGAAARALEFLILTAARTGEVRFLSWSEVDPAAKTWTVPRERMKGDRQHRVPLTDAALAVLGPSGAGEPWRFGKTAMQRVLATLEPQVTVHGMRSTFRDWAGETTNYPREVIETALAHTTGGAVERSYARGDLFEKRRELMIAWEEYCDLANY
jgi:integrase